MTRTIAPYGTWPSPLTAARVTAGKLRFDHLVVDEDDLYWAEGRASEGGRSVIVRRTREGRLMDITPPGFNVRSRVHEYGGAAYTVHRGTVYFSHFDDQRVYRQQPGGTPEPITAAGCFYADCRVDARRDRLIGVREDHTRGANPSPAERAHDRPEGSIAEPVNAIVSLACDGRCEQVLVEGADFYSDPVLDRAGARMAWLQWNHPNMPWDGTELWVADVTAAGAVTGGVRVAGGADESIFQPEWSPDGQLYFVSDRTGWWNLHRATESGGRGRVEAVLPRAAEFGKPQWTFTQTTYAFIDADRLVATYTERGRWHALLLHTRTGIADLLPLTMEPLESLRATARDLFFIGGSARHPVAIVTVPVAAGAGSAPPVGEAVIRSSRAERIEAPWIAPGQPITFESDGRPVHAFHYAPTNPGCVAPAGERPPLLVLSHGGPTGATSDILDDEVQFWTSRGFAVLDVNYSGSTGYGRAYRERLNGAWGIADVADCVNGARHLVATGHADAGRLIIRGGSAGGYTTLAALTFHDTFRAGASYYGISDIEVLARDTHKFESRYLDSLVGPYPAARERYRERSPIHHTARLSCALILFQGLEDKVVPPNQSEMMAAAVRQRGLPVAYVAFPGEQHGFRNAANIVRSLEAELFFYGAVFGFTPADPIAPVAIDNLG